MMNVKKKSLMYVFVYSEVKGILITSPGKMEELYMLFSLDII